jgi:hypothetical protein
MELVESVGVIVEWEAIEVEESVREEEDEEEERRIGGLK